MEQVRMKRVGLGLRGHDPARAYQGHTLFAPNQGDGIACPIDMASEAVHTGAYNGRLARRTLQHLLEPRERGTRLRLEEAAIERMERDIEGIAGHFGDGRHDGAFWRCGERVAPTLPLLADHPAYGEMVWWLINSDGPIRVDRPAEYAHDCAIGRADAE